MLVAGNWKMNGQKSEAMEFLMALEEELASGGKPACDLLICPPATLLWVLSPVTAALGISLGAQDCHEAAQGAHTGDLSAGMLADAGCRYVIVGHSERRSDHGESDETVRNKAEAALAAGLVPVVCIGESEAQRDAGETLTVVESQLRNSLPKGDRLVVAYEPVWAIGTGRTPTVDDVAEVHARLRTVVRELLGEAAGDGVPLLYGGSVKPDNAASLMAVPDVDGALVGGASLKAQDFLAIARACPED